MLAGNDHGEDAYGILEPDVNTINIDGRHNVLIGFMSAMYTYCVLTYVTTYQTA